MKVVNFVLFSYRLFNFNIAVLLLTAQRYNLVDGFSITKIANLPQDMAHRASEAEDIAAPEIVTISAENKKDSLYVAPITIIPEIPNNHSLDNLRIIENQSPVDNSTPIIILTTKFTLDTSYDDITTAVSNDAEDTTTITSSKEINKEDVMVDIDKISTRNNNSNIPKETTVVVNDISTNYPTKFVTTIVSGRTVTDFENEGTTEEIKSTINMELTNESAAQDINESTNENIKIDFEDVSVGSTTMKNEEKNMPTQKDNESTNAMKIVIIPISNEPTTVAVTMLSNNKITENPNNNVTEKENYHKYEAQNQAESNNVGLASMTESQVSSVSIQF